MDFLKTISTHPSLKYFGRSDRWKWFGVVNEPCSTRRFPDRPRIAFGIGSMSAIPSCPRIRSRTKNQIPSVQNSALRQSDEFQVSSCTGSARALSAFIPIRISMRAAEKKWDPERFYTDPSYYNNQVPAAYRVGMVTPDSAMSAQPDQSAGGSRQSQMGKSELQSRGFDLSGGTGISLEGGSVGFRLAIFSRVTTTGTLDTSLVSSDYIINPRTMNAIYNLGPRACSWRSNSGMKR